MKFAHEFKGALEREGYPQHWVEKAIPYGQLKKCLKKVQLELSELGLDPGTLKQLLAPDAASSIQGSDVLVIYNLDPCESQLLRPRLTVFVHLRDGIAVDASLSPASRAFVQKLKSTIGDSASGTQPLAQGVDQVEHARDLVSLASRGDDGLSSASPCSRLQRIEVPLVFDGQFFQLLQDDVASIDALQREEQKSLTTNIVRLGQEISKAAKPSRFSKSDLYRWREIFDLYLQARIFFSTQELDHGARTSSVALGQLVWFQNQVQRQQLPAKFKIAASREAYHQFLELNATLLQNLKFQEINKTAVTKILKKFDKRTSLGVSKEFPAVVPSDSFMAKNVARDICAQISTEIVSLVPRIDDYLCPVCFGLAWMPVRLLCGHVFCIRCMVKMQRKNRHMCPLCRGNVVMKADITNLDEKLIKYMERYFPKETKEKQKANETERGKELFGDDYEYTHCSVM